MAPSVVAAILCERDVERFSPSKSNFDPVLKRQHRFEHSVVLVHPHEILGRDTQQQTADLVESVRPWLVASYTATPPPVPVVNDVPGPPADAQGAQSSNVHPGCSSDADVTVEDSIRHVNKATQEIKVMQDTTPPGELEDVKDNVEAKISPSPNLFRHNSLHVLQPLNVLPPDATRRKRSLRKLPVMLNLHVKRSHVLGLRKYAWNSPFSKHSLRHRVRSRRVRLFITCCLICNHHLASTTGRSGLHEPQCSTEEHQQALCTEFFATAFGGSCTT